MSAITAKASRKMKKYAVLTREPRCFLGSFDFSWEQRKFSDITFPAGEKNKDNLPLESYSITNEHGFVPQDEKFENGGTMREADKRMYYIVSPNSFAYNPARINVGSIGYQNIGKNVIVSSLYEVFKTSEDVDDRLLWHWFKSPDFQKLIMQLQEGGVRLYFYYDKLCMGEVSLPSLEEQRKIGKLFNTLDNLITLHQRKCVFLFGFFQAFISMIFTASTFSWEQRKAKEICSIGTGKSNTQDQVDDGKYPFYIRSDVPVRSNKYLYDCEAVITIGDGNIGKVFHYVNGKFDLHQRCYKMTDFKDIWGKYFFYYFSTKFYDRAMKMTAKATVDSVRLEMISEMDIKKPPQISEQKQIAEFFANLDNLITLHQRECISFTARAGRLILTANKKRNTSSWEQRKAKELFVSTADKGYPELPVLSATQDRGMIRRDENSINIFHDKKNEAGYKRVLPGQFVIHLRSFQGGFAHSAIEGITSPAYTVFGFSEPEKHNSEYWKYVFTSKSFIRRLETVTYGIRDGRSISYEEFLTLDFVYPSKAEQTAIARYLDKLSNLITLHQRKPFLMKWRTSDANRNQTNRLVL